MEPKRNQIMIDGRPHTIVTPAKHMFKSTMVHDVMTTGGMLVVDNQTLELKIHRPKEDVKEMPISVPEYWFNFEGSWWPLSADYETAIVQLTDHMLDWNRLGGIVRSSRKPNAGVVLIKGVTPNFLIALKEFYVR